MEDKLRELELKIVELNVKYEKILEEIDALKAESTSGGIILDGCNDEVRKFIEQETKKEGDR